MKLSPRTHGAVAIVRAVVIITALALFAPPLSLNIIAQALATAVIAQGFAAGRGVIIRFTAMFASDKAGCGILVFGMFWWIIYLSPLFVVAGGLSLLGARLTTTLVASICTGILSRFIEKTQEHPE